MTTQTLVPCPVCKQSYPPLEGKLPTHSFKGDRCPGSWREPGEWPLPPAPGGSSSSATVPESTVTNGLPHSDAGIGEAPATKPQRRPRSDKGSKRSKGIAIPPQVSVPSAVTDAEPMLQDDVQTLGSAGPPAAPKAKRRAKTYLVATGDVTAYGSLVEACAALGEAMAQWDARPEGAEGWPPTLIVGRELKTKYEPAKTIPATVRIVRGTP